MALPSDVQKMGRRCPMIEYFRRLLNCSTLSRYTTSVPWSVAMKTV
ncbi:MAG: hypothetical protein NTU88_13050 [Armatimonadetes bacterium]|nr:hypothetical protein [Armatimonadota bacterium]